MTSTREQYRKLPGHRRGFLRGASVWIAADHLLSVKSYRIREEYKRFHLSDVQAIVVAQCPRFHLSTRAVSIAFIWFLAYLVGTYALGAIPLAFATPYTVSMWAIAAALILVWLYISFAHSCRCRILTAVSRDELPSVYRTWTARRFLAQVEPRIAEVQGPLEGNPFEAVQAISSAPAAVLGETAPAPPQPAPRGRTTWSMLFVATLFVNAVAMLLTLQSPISMVIWLSSILVLIEVATMVGIFVQHHRRVLRPGMLRLAVATILKIGLSYYGALMVMSIISANTPGVDRSLMTGLPAYVVLRQIDAWVDLGLGLVGAALLLASEYSE